MFGPMWQFDGTTYPAPVATMSTDTLAVWADALQAARPPALRSRFADLLWVTRYGPKPLMFALEAVDSYVAAAASSFREDITVAHGLVRAYE